MGWVWHRVKHTKGLTVTDRKRRQKREANMNTAIWQKGQVQQETVDPPAARSLIMAVRLRVSCVNMFDMHVHVLGVSVDCVLWAVWTPLWADRDMQGGLNPSYLLHMQTDRHTQLRRQPQSPRATHSCAIEEKKALHFFKECILPTYCTLKFVFQLKIILINDKVLFFLVNPWKQH